MKFGPFPIHLIRRLQERLDEHGGTAEVTVDGDARDAYRALEKGRLRRSIAFEAKDLFHIEVPLEHVLMIKGELEAMGVAFTPSDFDAGLNEREYLCPKCEAPGPAGGRCPRHDLPLIEFGELAEWRRARNAHRRFVLFWVFIGLTALALAQHYSRLP